MRSFGANPVHITAVGDLWQYRACSLQIWPQMTKRNGAEFALASPSSAGAIFDADSEHADLEALASGSLEEAFQEQFLLVEERAAPRFLRTPFIHSGYRVRFSLPLCVHSLWRIHNETGNVRAPLVPSSDDAILLWIVLHRCGRICWASLRSLGWRCAR